MLAVTINIQRKPPELNELLALVKGGTEVVFVDGETAIARLIPFTSPHQSDSSPVIWVTDDEDETQPSRFWFGQGERT